MGATRGGAGLLLALAWAGGTRAADPVVGAGGWASERFGAHVAILRAGVTAASGTGYLLLSCEGGERRFRLSLPDPLALPPLARQGPVRGGTILLRGAGGPAQRMTPGLGRIVAAVALAGDRVLSRAETAGAPGGVVAAMADLLRTRPARLDLLFRPDGAARLPHRAVPLVLAMAWRDGDSLAIDDFASACAR